MAIIEGFRVKNFKALKDFRLDQMFFNNLSTRWHRNCALRSDYTRRQALVEIDVQGNIVFTASQSISDVGLDRKYKKNSFKTGIKNGVFVTDSEAIHKDGTGSGDKPWTEDNLQLGWEDIKDLQSGSVTKTYMDDTMPGGPTERTIEYHAPFDKCNREDDYNTVWAEFEHRFWDKVHGSE